MASIVMLYGLARSDTIGAIELDAVLSEAFQGRAEVTSHPVERGPSISDHIRPEPRAIDIVGIVSDFPVRPASDVAREWVEAEAARLRSWATTKRLASLGGPIGAVVPDPSPPTPPRMQHIERGRSLAAFEELDRLRRQRQLVRVITGFGDFSPMAITAVSTERTASSSSSLTLRISLQEIVTAVALGRGVPDDLLRRDQGKQAPKPAPPPVAEKARDARNRSLFHRAGGILGIFD